MNKNLLYTRVLVTIGCLLMIAVNDVAAQLVDDYYNIEVHFTQGYGQIGSDPCCVNQRPEQTWIATARNDTDSNPTTLFSTAAGAVNTPNTCYTQNRWTDEWGDVVSQRMGLIYGNTTGRFDYHILAWEDDEGDRCVADNGDDNLHSFASNRYVLSSPGSQWTPWEDDISFNGALTPAKIRAKYTWRHLRGDRGNPLDFGTITSGTKTHINNNRSTPAGADTYLGYRNDWSGTGFTTGNDVTYKFTISQSKKVTLSTDYPETTTGTDPIGYTSLTLLNSSQSVIATNTPYFTRSIVTKDLCPGTYYVVVEGFNNFYTGKFKLGVTAQALNVTAGAIVSPTVSTICPGEAISVIPNSVAATSTLGGITYEWYRRIYENGSPVTDWQHITSAGNGASSTNLGTLSAGQTAAIYRRASDCGSQANSNQIEISTHNRTLIAGSISGATSLPFPQEITENMLNSTANASASPAQIITWERSTNGGLTWTGASGSNSGQSYTIPTDLSATTKFRRKVANACNGIGGYNGAAYSNEQEVKVIIPNGELQGKVSSRAGSGVNNVTLSLKRTTPVPGGEPNKTYTTTTGTDGTYSFGGIYYGETSSVGGGTADFVITPSKGDHVFDPISLNRTFNFQTPTLPDANFTDESVFSITGNVVQKCATCVGGTVANPKTCPIKDVEFLINDQYLGNKSIVDGTYTVSVNEQGNYNIKPRFLTHEFEPDVRVVAVGEDLAIPNVNFVDTTTHVISGFVKAGCDQYMGRAELTFSQVLPDVNGNPVSPCFVHNITTNQGSGFYSIRLPAGKYKVSVNSVSDLQLQAGFNSGEISDFINALPTDSLVRDITVKDTTMNLIFEEKPMIDVVGLEGPCSGSALAGAQDLSNNPIFAQSQERAFTVRVFQGNPAKQCPARDDTLTITTNIQVQDVNEQFDSLTVNGLKTMTLVGGEPNIIAPYHKTLNFEFEDVWGRKAPSLNLTPVVTGIRSTTGSFVTVTPEIPLLILRDPPGDQSSSYWQQNTTIETATSFFAAEELSTSTWAKVKIGAEFEAGFGITTETSVWGEIGANLDVSGTSKDGNEVILATAIDQFYSTSTDDNSEIVGEGGDVYIGAAMNLKTAYVIEILFSPDTCSFYRKKRMIIANDGFATTYMYSENHILNTLIPTLTGIKNNPANTPAETANFENQINVWKQIVDNNEELKRKAKFEKNISFDGGSGPQTSSITSSSTGVSTIEFALAIDTELAAELGLEIAGSGVSTGVTVNFKMETGGSTTNTQTQSTTTGFTIDDNDPGDFFTVDVKSDPVYNTPVFDLVAGTSSCPYEAGTQPRDDIALSVVGSDVLSGIPANGQGIFKLNLGNTSQSAEARTYYLRYLVSSSTGSTVKIEGQGVGPYDYPLNYLEDREVTVGVTRFDPNVYSFEGMTFQAYDACSNGATGNGQIDVKKEVSVTANFQNACSPVTLALPQNGFVVNSLSDNLLRISITDYNYANLDNITLQYSVVGNSQWIDAVTLQKADLQNNAFGTLLDFNVSNLADGEYSFRLKLKCGLQTVYSIRKTGVIDRMPPLAFGAPQPLDDAYSLGDEISMSFNESLSCTNVAAANFTFTRLSNNATVPAVVSCFDNKIIVTPTVNLIPWLGDSLSVTLSNVTDKHGNISPSDFSWNFNIGNTVVDALIAYFANVAPSTSTFTTSSSSTSSTSTSINEDALGTLNMDFTVGTGPSADSVTVHFIVAGTATYGVDYSVSGHRTFDGNVGSITIPKGASKSILKIDPIADTVLESDETIILGILSGGDYNIGGNNKVTLTIINDDNDDCENGGLPFTQNNNTLGNTSLAADTYHKLLLESDGKVASPTTVIFKGEKSVTLKPGFQADGGSIFLATLEDCPNLTVGGILQPKDEKPQSIGTFSMNSNTVKSSFGSNATTQTIGKDGIVQISFMSETDQQFEIKLFNTYAAEIDDFSSEKVYTAGQNILELSTNDLKAGTYFLKFTGKVDGKVTYHKVVVAQEKDASLVN